MASAHAFSIQIGENIRKKKEKNIRIIQITTTITTIIMLIITTFAMIIM